MTAALKMALVGAGRMGANHARVISADRRARLSMVIDVDRSRAAALTEQFGGEPQVDLEEVRKCDAVIVAVPTEGHMEVAESVLAWKRPLLVEKPLATDPAEVAAIVRASAAHDVPMMCGFVERFNPVVETASSLLEELPLHILAVRHSPNTPRVNTSVVYDLLIHDIDLALRFMPETPILGMGGGRWSSRESGVDEIADCMLTFGNGAMATLSSSRMSQRKIRSLTIATTNQLIELDLLRQDISVYRHVRHGAAGDGAAGYRAETVIDIPFVRHGGEPLALQLSYFLDLVEGRVDAETERRQLLPPHEVAARVLRDDRSNHDFVRAPGAQ